MAKTDDLEREIGALRRREATLHAAILRINASLDLGTVLEEAVGSARALTGARYGVITTDDEAGVARDLVSSGLTPERHRELENWRPEGPRLVRHLNERDGPVRLPDLAVYMRSLGMAPTDLAFCRTFQATPMRHRGVHVGNFFLGEKEDGEEFTDADEEVLVLFASQAAAAIANARAHDDERRARADLEALVETSPVGVLVLNARTGRPASFNREARRIAERLRTPGEPPERLLETMAVRRADGTGLDLGEVQVIDLVRNGGTVRAEEMSVSVPDGRSARLLVSFTPIRTGDGEDGEVVSAVVVMQDLAPLDEIERQRAEFLSLVSHELRAPLAAIKGSAATLIEEAAALDPAETREFHRIIAEQAGHMRGLIGDLLDAGRIDAGTLSVAPEPSDLAGLVERARDTFTGGGGRHAVLADVPVDLPRVMADRRRVVQVLNNLLSNAARAAPETSPVRVSAATDGSAHVAVSVADEGRGVAAELLPGLFDRHAGTGPGQGLGLAVCKGLVEAHGGRIRAESAGPGRGTAVTFTLPVAGESGTVAPAKPPPERALGEPPRVLVVDDDPNALRFVRDALTRAGYAPLVTGDPEDIAKIVRREAPRLVLLDLVLPGKDGIALMQEVPELSDVPVIFISGYGRDETVAAAFEAGAADYVVKPFSPTELVARVRAALRRREAPEPFVSGDLSVEFEGRRVTVAGEKVALTATEFDLLRVLALDAGRVVPRDALLRRVWGDRKGAKPNSLRLYVRSLRRKLGDDAADPKWIFSERGVGYRMAGPED